MSQDDKVMRSYYGARAPEYDRIYQKPERQDDLAAMRAWLPGRFADARVLEVACGTGYWTQFLVPVAKQLVGIDTAPETLAIARQRVSGGGVDFRLGDAYALPRELGLFDAAFAGFWFSHVPISRRTAFFAGLSACLRPGGRVVLLDNLYVEGSSTPISERDREGNTFQTRPLADGTTHRVLKNFPGEAELVAATVDFGTEQAMTRWEYYWAFEYVVR